MKSLFAAAIALTALSATAHDAMAQRGPDAVPITRNWRGEPACPSNYVIRGGACVSIYAGRGGYAYGDDRGYRRGGRQNWNDSYARGRAGAVPPRMNRLGEMQCPSNYVIRGGMCVSLY